jgi:DNA polymerase-3 subunit gamma/tau
VDLIEVDAASRTKVEDTRELLDNVQYAPSSGRYKIYLIDEVHMLSGHSFNALLKTLEEPPAHVKFLLATTDPQKLPVTILSRCLQFNLKAIPSQQIADQLTHILRTENVPYEQPAVQQLAQAAHGSLRDALSLTEQAIALSEGQLKLMDVNSMLGSIDRQQLVALLTTLAQGDAQHLLDVISQLAELAPDYSQLTADLIGLIHQVAIAQVLPKAINEQLYDPQIIRQLAQQLTAEDAQLYYQVALMGQQELALAPDPRVGFEMLMLRMLAFRFDPALAIEKPLALPLTQDKTNAQPLAIISTPQQTQQPEQCPASLSSQPAKASKQKSSQTQSTAPSKAITTTKKQPETDPQQPPVPPPWHQLIDQLKLSQPAYNLASHCLTGSQQDNHWQLLIAPNHEALITSNWQQEISKALSKHLGKPVDLTIDIKPSSQNDQPTPAQQQQQQQRQWRQQTLAQLTKDPNIQALQQHFSATIDHQSLTPISQASR